MDKPNVRVTLALITPETASEMLTHNTRNRKVKPARVSGYANMMSDDMWKINTSIIAFDVNGVLINGQHTLMACVKSGKDIWSCVGYGFPEDTYQVIDQGATRSAADIAKDDDVHIRCTASSATINYLLNEVLKLHDTHQCFGYTRVENTRKYRHIARWVYEVKKLNKRNNAFSTYAPALAAMLCAIANGVDMDAINGFIDVGENNIETSAGRNCKAALDYARLKSGNQIQTGQVFRSQSFKLASKAIYLYVNNIKKTSKEDFYPVTLDMIDRLNEQFRLMYESEE